MIEEKKQQIFTHFVQRSIHRHNGMVRGIPFGLTSRTIQFPIDLAAMNRIIKTVLIKFIEWFLCILWHFEQSTGNTNSLVLDDL